MFILVRLALCIMTQFLLHFNDAFDVPSKYIKTIDGIDSNSECVQLVFFDVTDVITIELQHQQHHYKFLV